ncbi:MAG: hypothetical protein H5U40_19095, partial [Polyangiaceae bacterium]|nr:hypothetical protein [Polyangiaceae bacterium]
MLGVSILVLFFAACARTGLRDFIDVDRDGEADSGLPRVDGGVVDCSRDADCDDGLACNGSERCERGEC